MLSSSLMEKNTQDGLSDAQAEEVADTIDALTFELRAELKVLGTELDTLGKDMDELAAKVDEMDVPEDNIEFGAEIKTAFEAADYGDDNEKQATLDLWDDGDALDGPDPDEFPAEQRFWQEIGLNAKGNLGEAEFNLDIDTMYNALFTEESVGMDADWLYEENTLSMDSLKLDVSYNGYNASMGDFGDYTVAPYFVDEEDTEGIEVSTTYMENDINAFAMGMDYDFAVDSINLLDISSKVYDGFEDTEIYGLTAGRDMEFGRLTGKLYHARERESFDYNADSDTFTFTNQKVDSTNVAVALENVALTDAFTMGGEVVFNSWEDKLANGDDETDFMLTLNGEFVASDALTINGKAETVGSDFYAVANDLAGEDDQENRKSVALNSVDYDLFEIGAEYVINDMNTVDGSVSIVAPGDDNYTNDAEDKYDYSVGLENVYGDFTNNVDVSFTQNDAFEDEHDVRVIELGTEYAWNETTTLGAALVNKDEEDVDGNVINYNYLKGTVDKELAENMTWNTEIKWIDGEVDDTEDEGTGNAFTTSLTVSF